MSEKKLERVYEDLGVEERINLIREIEFSEMAEEQQNIEIRRVVETTPRSEAFSYNLAALREMEKRYQWVNYKRCSEMLEKAFGDLELVSERRKKLILQVGSIARMLILGSNLRAKERKDLMIEWSDDFTAFMYSSSTQSHWFLENKLKDSEFLANLVKRLAELELHISAADQKLETLTNDELKLRLPYTYVLALEIAINEFEEFWATSILLVMANEKEPKDLSEPDERVKMLLKGREYLKTRYLEDEVCKDTEEKYQKRIGAKDSQKVDTKEILVERAVAYIRAALAKEITMKDAMGGMKTYIYEKAEGV